MFRYAKHMFRIAVIIRQTTLALNIKDEPITSVYAFPIIVLAVMRNALFAMDNMSFAFWGEKYVANISIAFGSYPERFIKNYIYIRVQPKYCWRSFLELV